MHTTSMTLMRALLKKHVGDTKTVVDVGSYDVNGSYRKLCDELGLEYTGVDLSPGPNVDCVQREREWTWPNGKAPRFDLAITGQCLEHCRRPWEVVNEIGKIADRCILIAPFSWPIHGHPVDCFRFVPDGMRSLLNDAGLYCSDSQVPADTNDCYAIGTRDATELKSRAHFADLINVRGYKTGMEIGVKRGAFSAFVLSRSDIDTMVAIDPWSGQGGGEVDYELAKGHLKSFGPRCVIDRRHGTDAAKDYKVDFAYVDALHDYDNVKADIEAVWPSINSGGILAGHDYFQHGTRDFGVIRAVTEFSAKLGLTVNVMDRDRYPSWWVEVP
jgi:hypothetical protein